MSPIKIAVAESLKSPERELSAAPTARSPSPPASDARAASLSPLSPKPPAARLSSPPPEPTSALEREKTPAPPLAASAKESSTEPEADATDEEEETAQDNVIDLDTFHQLLDLDEDDTHDFSLGMAEAYFTQASTTFTDMDTAFENKDLPKLSSLGHFLKGSSAALGVSAVQATCEHIQHYGALRDEANGIDLTEDAALGKIGPLLKRVKREYAIAEGWLKKWYKEHAIPSEV